ncbi:MAG: hypothetical protein E7548_05520 [Ruminococcaceae bacterium]|nr:hypothetical protein [Oscillospiraceae bacterium]
MHDLIFALIAGIILIISIGFAIKNRNNMSSWISCVLLGVFFSTFFMVLPTEWIKEGKVMESPTLYSVLSSLLYSFKALGGRQDIAQLETVQITGLLKTLYIVVNYIMYALAPILASSLILSFIGDTGEKLRYFLSFSKKCYVFSEINENSLTLAKGIKKAEKRVTLIFCNTKKADKNLLNEAKKLGAITLYKSCKDLILLKRFKEYEFCLVSENEDDNIQVTEDIITKKNRLKKHKVTVNSFAQSGTNIEVMESMVAKKPCAVFESGEEAFIERAKIIASQAPKTKLVFFNVSNDNEKFKAFSEEYSVTAYATPWNSTRLDSEFEGYDMSLYYYNDKGKISKKGIGFNKNHLVAEWQEEALKIRFIDEIALFCNNLIFNYPLYDVPNGKREIFVLLIGCGRLGTQMLKTVSWCGQIEGYTLKIRVLDKKAKGVKQEFYSLYPEMNNYDIEFEDVEIESPEFESKVSAYANASFVCVATGSDDLNLSTAENVYRIIRRNYSGETPPIFSRVRKTIKSNNFEEKGSYLKERNIHLFGTTASVFSNDTLFNSTLENLAFAVHLCYNWALNEPKDSFVYKKALNDFCTSEYSRRSSMAAALHISAKLGSCGIIAKGTLPTDSDLLKFEEILKDDVLKLTLVKNEHDRWNAFMRSEGFRTVDFETVKKYAPLTRSHKDEAAKLHPCIVSWEELDILQEQYNKLQKQLDLKPSDFKEYDEKIVVEIPQIIRKARQLCEKGW